ncbi:MAG: SUMF1/EgtB/PvdO family nonheme iron enzyme [Anaerolineae bacterium]|nr:SUMF1/EgtB/PvdO family nonheme iron enzyme [Anaerolineae bacterium]
MSSYAHDTRRDLVEVPAGPFLFGPQKDLRELPAYSIDRMPVTNAAYQQFIDAHSDYPVPYLDRAWATPYNWDKGRRTFPLGLADHPVVHVAWYDAEAYAAWAGGAIPTEQEWEKAARGTDGRRYPWGTWDHGRCNSEEAGVQTTTPVGQYSPHGDSPYGCVDMAGNVWEWATTLDGKRWVLRGGSFVNDRLHARCAFHDWDLPDSGMRFCGLRLVYRR